MSSEPVLYAVDAAIATVTLNRPEKLNAYVPEMGDGVVEAFARARDDDAVRAVILTGAGRAFCAGVDLDYLRAGRPIGGEAFLTAFPRELLAFPKPVVVAINGPAIGVGVTLPLLCDVRLAADTAKLAVPFAKLGILPGLGSTHLLPRLVGTARALELVLSARTIGAAEAAEMGLVNRVVPADALAAEARALAGSMAEHRPEVLAAAKRLLRAGPDVGFEEALRREADESAALRRPR